MVTAPARLRNDAKRRVPGWALAGLAAMLGLALLLPALRLGAGETPDSAVYVGVAGNLAAGKGATIPFGDQIDGPLTQFPPLYPAVLALWTLLGVHPVDGAVALQALLFAGNITLTFLAIQRLAPGPITTGGRWVPAVGAALLASSPSALMVHQRIWSEGLFLLLALLAFLAIAADLKAPRAALLVGGAVLTGLATLTRFAGAAFVVALAAGLVLLGSGPWRGRLARAAAFTATALPIPALWLLYNTLRAGAATSRHLAFHPPGMDHLKQIIDTLSAWFLIPAGLPWVAKVALLLVIFVLSLIMVRRAARYGGLDRKVNPAVLLAGLAVVAYALFILLSLVFLDANIPLDERIVFPMQAFGLILAAGLCAWALPAAGRVLQASALALVVFAAAALWKDANWTGNLYTRGNTYRGPTFSDPRMVEAVRALPEAAPLYSNSPEALYLQTGRPALRLPRKMDLMSRQVNAAFHQELGALGSTLQEKGGAIVYFSWPRGQTLPTRQDLSERIPLRVLLETDAATLYDFDQGGT